MEMLIRGKKDGFVDEEVPSNYGYFSGYQPGVQDLDRQIARLKNLFLGLGDASFEFLELIKSGKMDLPPNTEKWGAVPNWKKRLDIFGTVYNNAVRKIFDLIKKTRSGAFYNYYRDEIGPERFQQSKLSIKFWNKLIRAQGNPDILVVPFQFGLLYRGNSDRRARKKFLATEFSPGVFSVGCFLLTHEERLRHEDDLWINCSGDTYNGLNNDVHVPILRFSDGKIQFVVYSISSTSDHFGSVSASLPNFPRVLS